MAAVVVVMVVVVAIVAIIIVIMESLAVHPVGRSSSLTCPISY